MSRASHYRPPFYARVTIEHYMVELGLMTCLVTSFCPRRTHGDCAAAAASLRFYSPR